MYCTKCGTKSAPDGVFCSACGTRLPEPPSTPAAAVQPQPPHPVLIAPSIAPTSVAAVQTPHPNPASERSCPVCHQSTSISKVSAVIDSGTSKTSGSAITFARRDGRQHLDSTLYGGTTLTDIAARCAPPARPHLPVFVWLMKLWLGSTAAVGLGVTIANGNIGAGAGGVVISIFTLWIPALVVTVVLALAKKAKYASLGHEWDVRASKLREAYYCATDDVIFDGATHSAPQTFRDAIFAKSVPKLPQRSPDPYLSPPGKKYR